MMLDEEPGRRGASAIDSRCARGEGASLRVAERYKKSRWWMHTAIRSLCSNGPDDARRDDVPIDRVAGFYDEPRTTAFSVHGVETEMCVWLRRSGRCAERCVEDCQGAVEARSQMKSHTATDSLCASRPRRVCGA